MKGLGQEHNDPVQHLCWTAGSQVQVTFPYYQHSSYFQPLEVTTRVANIHGLDIGSLVCP